MTMTVFAEVLLGETFMDCYDHNYYTKIKKNLAVLRSPGGDQPYMRTEVIFFAPQAVITNQHKRQMPEDLLPYDYETDILTLNI